jgi:hypothetical protein
MRETHSMLMLVHLQSGNQAYLRKYQFLTHCRVSRFAESLLLVV